MSVALDVFFRSIEWKNIDPIPRSEESGAIDVKFVLPDDMGSCWLGGGPETDPDDRHRWRLWTNRRLLLDTDRISKLASGHSNVSAELHVDVIDPDGELLLEAMHGVVPLSPAIRGWLAAAVASRTSGVEGLVHGPIRECSVALHWEDGETVIGIARVFLRVSSDSEVKSSVGRALGSKSKREKLSGPSLKEQGPDYAFRPPDLVYHAPPRKVSVHRSGVDSTVRHKRGGGLLDMLPPSPPRASFHETTRSMPASSSTAVEPILERLVQLLESRLESKWTASSPSKPHTPSNVSTRTPKSTIRRGRGRPTSSIREAALRGEALHTLQTREDFDRVAYVHRDGGDTYVGYAEEKGLRRSGKYFEEEEEEEETSKKYFEGEEEEEEEATPKKYFEGEEEEEDEEMFVMHGEDDSMASVRMEALQRMWESNHVVSVTEGVGQVIDQRASQMAARLSRASASQGQLHESPARRYAGQGPLSASPSTPPPPPTSRTIRSQAEKDKDITHTIQAWAKGTLQTAGPVEYAPKPQETYEEEREEYTFDLDDQDDHSNTYESVERYVHKRLEEQGENFEGVDAVEKSKERKDFEGVDEVEKSKERIDFEGVDEVEKSPEKIDFEGVDEVEKSPEKIGFEGVDETSNKQSPEKEEENMGDTFDEALEEEEEKEQPSREQHEKEEENNSRGSSSKEEYSQDDFEEDDYREDDFEEDATIEKEEEEEENYQNIEKEGEENDQNMEKEEGEEEVLMQSMDESHQVSEDTVDVLTPPSWSKRRQESRVRQVPATPLDVSASTTTREDTTTESSPFRTLERRHVSGEESPKEEQRSSALASIAAEMRALAKGDDGNDDDSSNDQHSPIRRRPILASPAMQSSPGSGFEIEPDSLADSAPSPQLRPTSNVTDASWSLGRMIDEENK